MFDTKPTKMYLFLAMLALGGGFYVYRLFYADRDWSVHCGTTTLWFWSCTLVFWWALRDIIYHGGLEALSVEPKKKELEPRKIPNLNAVFEQTTQAVKIDKKMEQRFAQVLLAMHGLEPEDKAVDLRESFWIEIGKRDKFQSRDEYLTVRNKWADYNILLRLDPNRKNSPFYVADWNKVNLISRGEKLQ